MSIDLVKNAPTTPAREASIQSMECSIAGDQERWLALFADDAVVQYPYGPSPMDPEGKGRVGKDEIAKFCAQYIRKDAIRFEVRQTLNGGPNVCVNVGTIFTKGPDGGMGWNEVINVYEVNEEGKITLLRSYWDFDANMKTFF